MQIWLEYAECAWNVTINNIMTHCQFQCVYTTFSNLDSQYAFVKYKINRNKNQVAKPYNKKNMYSIFFYQIEVPHWECVKLGPVEC